MMSTRSMTWQCSWVPRPFSPRKPTACESSIITMAPCSSARSQTPFRSAMMPSMENTPSVTTRRNRQPAASTSFARRSSRSEFR